MKILFLNKNNYIKGGSDTYLFSLIEGLENKGHETIIFSMEHENNFKSKYSRYFVKNIDYKDKSLKNKIKNACNLINSKEAYENLCELIEATKPDVAHINLIYHQLTLSVIHALRKYNIPMIFVAHDFKILCPSYKIYHNKKICRQCYNGKFFNCTKNKCHKNSLVNSFIVTLEAYFHKIKKSYSYVDYIIAPSKFVKNELELGGIESKKILVMNNFLTLDKLINLDKVVKENYVLYYGRLSYEKGIDSILELAKELPNIEFKIVGKGAEEEKILNYLKQHNIKNVDLMGFKSGIELQWIIAKAKITIQPSMCAETFGLTVIESMSLGTPVIVSDNGALKENIDSKSGFIYENNDKNQLKQLIEKVYSMTKEEYKEMEKYCIEKAENYSKDEYLSEILKLYKKVINEKGKN